MVCPRQHTQAARTAAWAAAEAKTNAAARAGSIADKRGVEQPPLSVAKFDRPRSRDALRRDLIGSMVSTVDPYPHCTSTILDYREYPSAPLA
jgi:hypothetical protein